MQDDLMAKAKDQMNVVENVLAGVPGIKGYKEKELRRETDKTVRTMVARQLDDQKARLTNLQVDLVNNGQLDLLDDMERAATKLQTLSDRVRTASYGYAPLFDDVRVKEAELDALGQFDQAMFQDVVRISTIIDGMAGLSGRPDAEWLESIRALTTTLDNLNTQFGRRSEVILQAGAATQ
ncbi:MAG: hypothetical protein V9H69_23175 [Anaerolineae bacterium]|jgi:hypothetical protein